MKVSHFQVQFTTIKLTSTNKNINGIFLSVDYGELYRHNSFPLYPSVNTNRNIFSVYIKRITMKKKN
jgi:hypothetical protein